MWLISKKVLIKDSGLLEGFRDCHCHLLPGVDDGVTELDKTLRILETWSQHGVKEVWLTPHIMEDIPNEPADLKQRFEQVTAAYKGPIQLHLAAEHMMDGLFTKRIEENNVLPIGEDGERLLVETSYYIPPMNMSDIIEQVKKKGYDPILAHPERYQYMSTRDYKRWKQKGVLLQLNVPSLVGAYGPEAQQKAEWLLKEHMYDYCGSDTHSVSQVGYFLNSEMNKKTVKLVRKLIEEMEL